MKVLRFYFHRVSPLTPRMASRLFWHLFTKPRPRRFSSVDESFYKTAKSKSYTSEQYDTPYTVHERGSGPKKVLILHGWEGRSSDFGKLISNLEEEMTVYTVDFPGHGKSPKSRAHLPIFMDVIKSVLDQFEKIEAVMGHSLGAASLAMTFGKYDFTSKVNKLIFLGLHPEPSQYFIQYKSATKVNEKVFKRSVNLAERKTGVELLNYSCYNFLDKYRKYQMYFVHDEKDKIINVKRIEELATHLNNSIIFKGDHGGHFRHYKHDEVITEIRRIINNFADDI